MAELLRLLSALADGVLSGSLPHERRRVPLSDLEKARNEARVVLKRFESGSSDSELHWEATRICIELASLLSKGEGL